MNMSFYTGAIGADTELRRMAVISNNLANVNNYGFKPKTAVFEELINYNLNDSREAVTELQAGASVAVARTSTDFYTSSFHATYGEYDFALGQDHTFFTLRDPESGEVTYTRDGHFHIGEVEDGRSFLLTASGKLVLDQEGEPITAGGAEDVESRLGICNMSHPSRLLNVGDNEFALREGDTVNVVTPAVDPYVQNGAVESSATDMAREMSRVIETQRAFTYALKMVTTSDEVEQTINQLRS